MTTPSSFICPVCAHICWHPLEVKYRWCPKCERQTGPPPEPPPPVKQPEWAPIRDAMDDCLIAIEHRRPLPTKALRALPPYRALMMATVGVCADVGLQDGTYAQLKAEASAVGGDGQLGEWWRRTI